MFASAIRRFSVAAPRLTPPPGSMAKSGSSAAPSSSRRVGMMPSKQESSATASAPSSQEAKDQIAQSSNFDDVLTVGNVSSHCDGQKISRASEGSI
ncbi:hypothetical protein CBS101457_002517 [Exobasidium rhododendri]|nr:hypothetical protein CBS101457_002517 [Exobasidium rhododendri]